MKRTPATYLNHCSMGLPTARVQQALAEYLREWTTLGAGGWDEVWLDRLAEWRKLTARLVGCRSDEIAWLPSVGAGLGSLASALAAQAGPGGRLEGRDDVVLADLEFPAALAAFSPNRNLRVRTARSVDGLGVEPERYAAKLGERSRAVIASRVFYGTGAVQDVAAIAAAARRAGAFSILDDYHGTGQIPLDVKALGVDAAVGGSLKWLRGGIGSAWMYVDRRRIRGLEPAHSGWWANQGMLAFTGRFRYWDDARRFECGEVNLPSLATATEATRELLELGPARVGRRIQSLRRDLVERLVDAGHVVREHANPARRSGIIMVPRADAAADVTRLARRGVTVDARGPALRVSPHHDTESADLERFVQALGKPRPA
ncbi:MAG: aminotransferase class V-fold PLP-dependent enzyme [Candidatus Thermoplasmatota archaeon]